ncbi:hypothetical protein EA187_04665 [Lujinxingia sediminis]|uniref:Uncharacterized protein n=1 Tax=Lujinxingia sediminis TaxID=2480984 RepID=A0ABY0CXV7_9DELT|nr:hypothetical protein [Lujinxingia sediminis]RVU48727.1 hypothetical protein EA187_04665 [Lujinxingia sediminis]
MSTNNNKPDLSDLKARLGLKPAAKPGASTPAGADSASSSGARSTIPRPGAASSATSSGSDAAVAAPSRPVTRPNPAVAAAQPVQSQPSQPAQAAPAPVRAAGPPAAAAGPPPTAMVPPPKAKPEPRPRPVPMSEKELAEIDAAASSMEGGGIFSKNAIIVMVVLALLGAFFGFFAAQGQNSRQIEVARIEDAKALQESIDPALATFSEMAETIAGLSPSKVDFEAADSLASRQFVVSGEVLSSNRLLLGRDVIHPLTAYMAESAVLGELLAEHKRLTTVVDKAEIERLLSENEVLEEDLIAVVFDYRHLFTQGGNDAYRPRPGRLVTLKNLERDGEGMLEASMLNSERTQKVEMQSLVPLERGEILKTAGDNALQRYERRVNEIKERAEKLKQRVNPLSESLGALASASEPPLLSL